MPHRAAEIYLAKTDPVMRRLIKSCGPCTLKPETRKQPYESLMRAVAHQQLHGKVAETIFGRFLALYPGRFPKPEAVLKTKTNKLRACGFSASKVAALQDIARHAISGTVPTLAKAKKLSDAEIIARLVQIRGVGQWTAEMLLIFHLGRPDVLPVDDFGIRNGFRIAYGLDAMPKPRELAEYGLRWRPHCTVASWYLWRAVDQAKAG